MPSVDPLLLQVLPARRLRVREREQGASAEHSREQMSKQIKSKSKKTIIDGNIWTDGSRWKVVEGSLKRPQGRPGKVEPLFQYVGEKLPFGCLEKVREAICARSGDPEGIYMAHDSMGAARYGGRGKIFDRLLQHRRDFARELLYFSFYVIRSKNHERELETVILRAAGPQMSLNERKVRSDIDPGDINDYEPGTHFFERQLRRGRKANDRRANQK